MNSLTRSDLGSFEENDQQIANFLLDERETVQFICESLSEIDFFGDKIGPLFEDGAAGAPTGLISVFKEEFSALIYLVWFWKSYEAKSDAQMEDEESSILVRQLFAGLYKEDWKQVVTQIIGMSEDSDTIDLHDSVVAAIPRMVKENVDQTMQNKGDRRF